MSIFKRIAKAVSSDTLKAGAMKAADLNPRLVFHINCVCTHCCRRRIMEFRQK